MKIDITSPIISDISVTVKSMFHQFVELFEIILNHGACLVWLSDQPGLFYYKGVREQKPRIIECTDRSLILTVFLSPTIMVCHLAISFVNANSATSKQTPEILGQILFPTGSSAHFHLFSTPLAREQNRWEFRKAVTSCFAVIFDSKAHKLPCLSRRSIIDKGRERDESVTMTINR